MNITVPDELVGAINKTRISLNTYATTAQKVIALQPKHAALGFTHEQARHLTNLLLEEMQP